MSCSWLEERLSVGGGFKFLAALEIDMLCSVSGSRRIRGLVNAARSAQLLNTPRQLVPCLNARKDPLGNT
jgi:hypothetical protein